MPYKKGKTKTGGRVKGTPNKPKEKPKFYSYDQVLLAMGYAVGVTTNNTWDTPQEIKDKCINLLNSLIPKNK